MIRLTRGRARGLRSALGITMALLLFAAPAATLAEVAPPAFSASVRPSEGVIDPVVVTIPPVPPKIDIVFAFDRTGSMHDTLAAAKAGARDIMTTLREQTGSDIQFGVVSYMDYPASYTSYGYTWKDPNTGVVTDLVRYGNTAWGEIPTDVPYEMNISIDPDIPDVEAAINALDIRGGGDGPEGICRTFYETYADPEIGWRPGARRVVINFSDSFPHDNDLSEGTGWPNPWLTGGDPGRDGVMFTEDDLDFQQVMAEMLQQNIQLIEAAPIQPNPRPKWFWDYWTATTDGSLVVVDNTDFTAQTIAAIESALTVASVEGLTLKASAGYEEWLANVLPTTWDGAAGQTAAFDTLLSAPAGSTGRHTFTLTAVDSSGVTYGEQTVVLDVNSPPESADGYLLVPEDADGPANLWATDPDGDDLTYRIVDGPVHGTLTGTAPLLVYTPEANYNGPDSFTFAASDGVEGSNIATFWIDVEAVNDPPVATGESMTTAEDNPLSIPVADVLANDTDIEGDGLSVAAVGSKPEFAHGTAGLADGVITYWPNPDYNGPAAFRYQVSDGHGGLVWAIVNVTVTPVNDTPVAVADSAVTDEDTALTIPVGDLLANDTDADAGDVLTVTLVRYRAESHGTASLADGIVTFTPDADYGGPASFRYDIRDAAGRVAWAVVNVAVNPVNDAPIVTVDLPTVEVDEGQVALNFGNAWDPDGVGEIVGVSAGTIVHAPGLKPWTWSLQTADGPGQSQTVRVDAVDTEGASATGAFELKVANVPPSIGTLVVPVAPVQRGTQIDTSASFSDPGTADTHTAVWDWGDGTTSAGVVSEAQGSGSVAGSHVYASAGVYTVGLTVTDSDGAPASVRCSTYSVVYDPGAGFVTGGGWVTSPAGACPGDPTQTGKATIGFVSKYLPNRLTPDGETQFKVGDINFHSREQEWLVVGGYKAQYQGIGTINGVGRYRFLLTGIDGRQVGGGGIDRFRMRIWEATTGAIVYDNMPLAPDWADPLAALNGKIQLHKN